jgi:hypothetical protein
MSLLINANCGVVKIKRMSTKYKCIDKQGVYFTMSTVAVWVDDCLKGSCSKTLKVDRKTSIPGRLMFSQGKK